MNSSFPCPHCGHSLQATPEQAGSSILCPACGAKTPVPRWKGRTHAAPAPAALAPAHPPSEEDESLNPFALLPSTSKHSEDLIDMTAMVDIVFFLLIFFLFTSMQALVAVMDMPSAHAEPGASSKAQTIAQMEADPEFLVIKIEEDDSIWVEDEQIFSDQDIRVRLRAERDKESEPRTILVLGNADASHGAAVRVFDACMDAGFEDIRLSVQEETDQPAG